MLITLLLIFLLNIQTAISYYNAAEQYGTKDVKTATFNWLLINLLSFYSKNPKWLPLISNELLTELVQSPDLLVMQTEFALYALLKVWMYLKLHADDDDDVDTVNRTTDVITQSTNYFEGLKSKQRPLPIKTCCYHLVSNPRSAIYR